MDHLLSKEKEEEWKLKEKVVKSCLVLRGQGLLRVIDL